MVCDLFNVLLNSIFKYFLVYLFIYSYVHTLFGPFLSLAPPFPSTPYFQAEPVLPSFFLIIHLFTCAYIGSFLPPASLLHPLPHQLPGRTCFTLISNFVEEKT
jgi:hypothetical protein